MVRWYTFHGGDEDDHYCFDLFAQLFLTPDTPTPTSSQSQKEKDGDAASAVAEHSSKQPIISDNRTAAEKRFDEQAAKSQEKFIQSMASKSHKDKVKDFNEYLSKLSEHHDIPKVGPG
ncbi:hypothetical protein OAD67_03395 [bacterium]|nr:hypothetical protein [bacterium]MDC1215759.1 hypothetical protein [bacterium]